MSYNVPSSNSVRIRGTAYEYLTTLTTLNVASFQGGVLPADEANLTVRSNATVGNLTVPDAANVTTTGARADLYFTHANGTVSARRGVTIGTIAGNVVPFSGGAGDDLPIANTTINIATPERANVSFNGNEATILGVKSDAACSTVVFCHANGTEIAAVTLKSTDQNQNVYIWRSVDGVTNPFGTSVVSHIYYSQGDTDGNATVYMDAGHGTDA